MKLDLKVEGSYVYDAVSLGEIMLRLDPGEGRIRTARSFSSFEYCLTLVTRKAPSPSLLYTLIHCCTEDILTPSLAAA